LCGSQSTLTSSNQFQDRPNTGSPSRGRVGVLGSSSGIGSQTSTGSDVTTMSASGIGGSGIIGGGGSSVRKSRSQGGKKLQKCLSTASYGEESSFCRQPSTASVQLTPLSHTASLLMTRQYCSFGTITLRKKNEKKI
jgi:hypothetical protein